MTNNIVGLIISIAVVFGILAIAEIIKKYSNVTEEFSRKFVHIGVSNWWLVAMYFIEDMKIAIIPPLLFIILNYISYKKSYFNSMNRDNDNSLGTVYYPISLAILVILFWDNGILGEGLGYIGAIGILIMGYGDGLAGLIGKKFGKIKIFNHKSLEGTLTNFIVSFLIAILFLGVKFNISLNIVVLSFIIALFSSILELITPHGLDNLTLPIGISILVYILTSNPISYVVIYRLIIGMIFSSSIGIIAFYKKSLTKSGMLGAIILGTVIYATMGFFGASTMILFFITSSFMSHFKKKKKSKVEKQFDKTGNRDIYQVFANGGIGLLYSILYFVSGDMIYMLLFIVSFAAANADTWSTELGILDSGQPISLRTFKRVPKGTSGAVSVIGSFSGFLGSFVVSIYSIILLNIFYGYSLGIGIIILLSFSGYMGTFIDSILGAYIQGIYITENNTETERKSINGISNKLSRGIEVINNDLVNIISITSASIIPLLFL